MRAIDLRYNKEIIGGKLNNNYVSGIGECKTKKEVICFLSNHGCPCSGSYKYKGGVNKCGGIGCIKCWEQEVEYE